MNKYTVNFICDDKDGHSVVRSEEFIQAAVEEAIDLVKKKWASWKVKILWAGIRQTDGGL